MGCNESREEETEQSGAGVCPHVGEVRKGTGKERLIR